MVDMLHVVCSVRLPCSHDIGHMVDARQSQHLGTCFRLAGIANEQACHSPSGNLNLAIYKGPFSLSIYLLEMVIMHSVYAI